MKQSILTLALLSASAKAGSILWSGIFNSSQTVAYFDDWSWSNQIAPWQWYIHGSGATSEYLGLSPSFKNPADTSDAQGLRTTIDGTAFWNGQTMERTEVIPQTSTNLGTGHLYYHFSLSTSSTNAPNDNYEHQIAFFESHFTELKYGTLSGGTAPDNTLRWMVSGVTHWSAQLQPGNWYNFAYDIDFSANTVGLWASSGSDPLTQVVAPLSASTSTNSADWHVGVLRLPNGGTAAAAEDYFWSGVFVEQAPITTDIAGPNPGAGGGSGSSSTTSTSSATSSTSKSTTTSSSISTTRTITTTTTLTTTTSASGPAQTHWGQCGGSAWVGPTTCAAPYTCQASNPYYSQCL